MTVPTRNWLLRLPAQMVVCTLLLVVALAPRHSLPLCTGDDCCADEVAAAPEPACDCCRSRSAVVATPDPSGRDGQNRGLACADCCIDVTLAIELGPLPDRPEPQAAAAARPGIDAAIATCMPEGHARTPAVWHLDTGPPRPDPRTRLLASTILRQ